MELIRYLASLLEQARTLTQHGFSVIPIKNKKPVLEKWTNRRKQLATEEELVFWFSNGKADSIAITINNSEFAIDTDGEGEQVFLKKLLPKCSEELREKISKTTYTKTPHGYHRIFKVRNEDFPEGISEKTYVKLNDPDHKHDEIALKGRDHYLVECGPDYLVVNDIGCLVTLMKEQVEELLLHLESLSPANKIKSENSDSQKQSKQSCYANTSMRTYHLDDTRIDEIVKVLLPFYEPPCRQKLVLACSGILHRWEIAEDSAIKIVKRLTYYTSDEESEKRLQAVCDTYIKSRHNVSGHNKFLEIITLASNDSQKAKKMVAAIAEIVSRARHEQGDESGLEHEDEQDDSNDLKGIGLDIISILSPHIFNIVSDDPPVMYVARNDNKKIVKAIITFVTHIAEKEDTKAGQKQTTNVQKQILLWKEHLIYAVPVKVSVNENPLDGNKTYQITFVDRSKRRFTIGPDSIGFIIDELTNRGKVLRKSEAVDALTAILDKYETAGLAEINNSIPYPGYYWVDSKVVGYDVTQNLDLDQEHNEEHKRKMLECIDVLDAMYAKNKNKTAYSTVLKWGIVAPFSYLKKCTDTSDSNWLPYLHLYGWTRTGKNTLGKITLAICRKLTKKDSQNHVIGFGNVDTPARLGNIMSKSTYPVLINEVGAMTSDKFFHIVEMIKHTVESLNVRGIYKEYRKYTNTPALSPLILTSNTPPPSDPAYRIRVVPLRFDKVHETTEQEKAEFNEWAFDYGNIYKLGILSDFAALYIVSYPDILKNRWDIVGKIILTEFYKAVGKQAPEWIDLLEKENVIEHSKDETYFGLRGFLEQAIIDGYRRDFRIDPEGMKITFEMRLSHCLEYRSVPYLLSHIPKTINNQRKIVITWNIIPELLKHKLSNISTLPALAAEIPGFKYGNMKINGNSKKVVSGRYEDLVAFLNCTVEEDGRMQGDLL